MVATHIPPSHPTNSGSCPVLDAQIGASARLRRREWLALGLFAPVALLSGCGGGAAPATPSGDALATTPTTRRWSMGFSRVSPRADASSVTFVFDQMASRAEFVVMQEHLPWAELLAGVPAQSLVERELLPMASLARERGLKVALLAELTDGLDRSVEPAGLVATGHRLIEPEVQARYAEYMVAAARTLQPAWLGLATETNAVRALAPVETYQGVVAAAARAASAVRAAGLDTPRMISVQVELAWGLLGGAGVYAGVAQDRQDFGFIDLLGLSSYPYFGHSQPEAIPLDYYSRLADGMPTLVVEGGWPSTAQASLASDPALQARYLSRQAELLDQARSLGVAQLLLADLDPASLSPEVRDALGAFLSLGLMDSGGTPKSALATWDQLSARSLQGA